MPSVLGFSIIPGYGDPLLVTYLVPGTTVKLTLRKEIAPLLLAVARDFADEIEPIKAGQCWGYNPRKIAGSNVWSNHAWGGAIDLNSVAHPMHVNNTFSPAKQAAIHKLLARYVYQGHKLIRWGGDYSLGNRDDMHWEINVQRDVALAAVKALQTPPKPAPSGGHQPGTRVLKLANPVMSGDDVAFAQRWVGAAADGKYGPATKARVVRYQDIVGVARTGVCDSATWSKMLGRAVKV